MRTWQQAIDGWYYTINPNGLPNGYRCLFLHHWFDEKAYELEQMTRNGWQNIGHYGSAGDVEAALNALEEHE